MQQQAGSSHQSTLFNHMQAFRTLARSPSVLCADLNGAMRDIIETLSKALPGANIGIWVSPKEDPHNWECLHANAKGKPEIKRSHIEELLNILDQEFIHTIDNTLTLPRRHMMPFSFFEMEKMCAQLCAGIQIDAQTLGVVCCEFEDSTHRWSIDEIYFTESIANFTSLFLIDYNRRMTEMKLFETMRNDRLTGLANASHFIQELKRKITERPDCPMILALLDIRGFRHINDIHGHDVGDEALKAMALTLTRRFPDALLGRTASNEFILARRVEDGEDLHRTSDILTSLLKTDLSLHQEDLSVEISIGAALYPAHANRVKSLIRKCDIALFKAKEHSRAGFITYNTQLGREYVQHIRLKKRLKSAIQDQVFINHYQPKVNLQTKRTDSGEVLIRWQDKHGHFISPAQFIPIAERTGMINDVSRLLHHNICQDLSLVSDFNQCSHILSINASVHELRNPYYVEKLQECARACHTAPDHFEIEVTESTFLDDDHVTRENLRRLRKKGFLLALDDFGTGYSSLSYLKQVQFDTIKIDRCFIVDIHQNAENREITTSLIKLFHTLGCSVVAEGVEKNEEADVLQNLGCDYAQGFLFAKPMGINRYTQYLDCAPAPPKPFPDYEI